MQDLLSCSSLVIFLNNYINVPSSFLRLEQSNFIIDNQNFGAHLIHGHHWIDLRSLVSNTFLACLALSLGHPELDRLILPLFFFIAFNPAFVYFLSYAPGVILSNYTNEPSSFPHLQQVNSLTSHHNLDACLVHRHRELNLPSYFSS